MSKHIGILTAGGDSPGLNATIRGVAKAALKEYRMQVIGFRDDFRGLVDNRTVRLESSSLSGILTVGGTILGTCLDTEAFAACIDGYRTGHVVDPGKSPSTRNM
jgi:6-phosphofructokinase